MLLHCCFKKENKISCVTHGVCLKETRLAQQFARMADKLNSFFTENVVPYPTGCHSSKHC